MTNEFERRKSIRNKILLEAFYEINGNPVSCEILDITGKGLTLRVKGFVKAGDSMKIFIEKEAITAKVINVNGNIVKTAYDMRPEDEHVFLNNLILSKYW